MVKLITFPPIYSKFLQPFFFICDFLKQNFFGQWILFSSSISSISLLTFLTDSVSNFLFLLLSFVFEFFSWNSGFQAEESCRICYLHKAKLKITKLYMFTLLEAKMVWSDFGQISTPQEDLFSLWYKVALQTSIRQLSPLNCPIPQILYSSRFKLFTKPKATNLSSTGFASNVPRSD